MKADPQLDNILIKPETVDQKTESGLIVTTEYNEPQARPVAYGRIVAIGPGPKNDSGETICHSLLVDDLVAYEYGEGFEIYLDAVEYRLLRVDNVLAKIDLEND